MLAPLVDPGSSEARGGRARLALALALVLGGVAAARPAAERLAHFDNFRMVLLDRAPVAGQKRWRCR
ncbi:MAG: hypothetical protein U0263_34940 [Polyangiaceae bacterium]